MQVKRLIGGFLVILSFIYPSDSYGQVIFEEKQDVKVNNGEQDYLLPWIGGLNAGQYNKVDLDGDGKEELLIYDRAANIYQIFTVENGLIQPANDLRVYLPDIPPGWVLFVDYDYDGRKDIFTNGNRGIIVFRNLAETGLPVSWEKVADPVYTTGFSGKINLIANAADVPAITDIDSDGDMDILVYNFAIGGYIRYNKNLSQELYGHSDSLEYEIKTRSWGEFEECECNLFAFNGETCEDISGGRVMHPGGKALLAIDQDGDGDKDLLVGHEQCIDLYFYENMGDKDSAYMVDFSNMFPDETNPANFHIFPAAYFEDLDFDGVKDLVVTPSFDENVEFKIDFGHSNWFYKNIRTDEKPAFVFQQNNLIQDLMIDFGDNTVPVLKDINADGKVDLLVASNGHWNGNEFSGYVVEFENTGAAVEPSFQLKNNNYLNLSSLEIINPKIDLIDFNGDKSPDLVYSGMFVPNVVVSWLFINQASVGEPVDFNLEKNEIIDLPKTATINDSPEFFDVDGDGYVDLLLGKSGGALEYYKNNGDNSFSLVDPAYLGINRDFSLERRNLVASIGDLDLNGQADLTATDSRGFGRVYFDFQSQTDGNYQFTEFVYKNDITDQNEELKFDQKSWVTSADIFDKGNESIIVGGVRGGLQLFENTFIGSGGEGETEIVVKIYPNPISDATGLNIEVNQNVTVALISLLGQTIIAPFKVRKYMTSNLDVGYLTNGTYILKSENEEGGLTSQLLMILK